MCSGDERLSSAATKCRSSRGHLGGKTQPAGADLGSFPLVCASVLPAQSLCGAFRDRLVVHGKEKVYGSIP